MDPELDDVDPTLGENRCPTCESCDPPRRRVSRLLLEEHGVSVEPQFSQPTCSCLSAAI